MLYLLLKTFKLYILLYSAYIVGWNKYQDACNAQENSLFKIFLSDIFLFFFFQETFSILFSKSRTSLKYSIREWGLMGEWINNHFMYIPTSIYLFKVKNENTRARCEICSKLKIRTPERHSGVFIVNFEHISHLVLVFLWFILNMWMPAGLDPADVHSVSLLTCFCVEMMTWYFLHRLGSKHNNMQNMEKGWNCNKLHFLCTYLLFPFFLFLLWLFRKEYFLVWVIFSKI